MGVIGLIKAEIAARKIWIDAKPSIQIKSKISESEKCYFMRHYFPTAF
jgi:hypothetical protein